MARSSVVPGLEVEAEDDMFWFPMIHQYHTVMFSVYCVHVSDPILYSTTITYNTYTVLARCNIKESDRDGH